MSTTKKVAWNSFLIFCGKTAAKLTEFVVLVYLARTLTVSGFGIFSFAQALLLYLLIIVDGGTSILGVKEVAGHKGREAFVVSNIFFLRSLAAAAIFALAALVLWALNISLAMKLFLLATFAQVFPRAFNAEWVYQGLERMGMMSLSKVMEQLICAGLVLALVHGFKDLFAVPLLQLISSAAVALVFTAVLWRTFVPFRWRDLDRGSWGRYLKASIPLGMSFIFIQVYYNLDIIMLGFMKSHEIVGWYNAVYKLFFVFLGSMGVFSAAVFPLVVKKFAAGKTAATRFLDKYLRLMLLGAFPAVCLGIICSATAVRLIYGGSYLPGVLALKILLLNLLVIAVSGVYGTLVLLPAEKNNEFMISVGAGALCNFILNLILIPAFSLAGAAAATLITELIVAGLFFHWARREVQLDWWPYLVKPAFASAIAFGAVILLFNFFRANSLFALLGSMSIFSFLYLLLIGLMGEKNFLVGFVRELVRRSS